MGDASPADYWQQTARAMPDKIAVVDNHGATYTHSALDHAASCLANWMLAKGVESAIVSHFNRRWCEFTVIYLACLKPVRFPCRCYLPAGSRTGGCSISASGKMFFAPTLFKQTRPVDLIPPLQNQLHNYNKLSAWTNWLPPPLPFIKSDSRRQYPLTTAITVHGDELAAVLLPPRNRGSARCDANA